MHTMKKNVTLSDRKRTKAITTIVSMLFAILLAQSPCIVSAENEDSSANEQHSNNPGDDNIGFMKNPPKKLTERFPMCDAFLNVEWIDKGKMIGYATYEAIMKGKAAKHDGERKRVWAMVDMKVPGFDYDVYQHRRKGKLDEVFEMVRNGTVNTRIPMMITYKGKTISLYPGKAVNDDSIHPLLSDHHQTVCIAYPDEQRVWIVEGKNAEHAFSKDQLEKVSERSKQHGTYISPERLGKFWVLDINFDGISDFVLQNSYFLMYSWMKDLFRVKRELEGVEHFLLTFPPKGEQCRVRSGVGHSLFSDGNNYYLDNQCNLTELTSY